VVVVDKWLNLLKGYFSVHNFFDREKINFSLLKAIPHVKEWWDTYSEKRAIEEYTIVMNLKILIKNKISCGNVLAIWFRLTHS
jgi:hypothetical protein